MIASSSWPGAAHAALIEEATAQAVYEQCTCSVASVVNIRKDKTGRDVTTGTGSGFVWSRLEDGSMYLVTNYHVISRLDKSTDVIQAVFPKPGGGAASYTARMVASDTMKDLAVLLVEAGAQQQPVLPHIQPLPVGTSNDLKIGQYVFALGAPYGLSNSLTAGVVSGLDRSIPSPVGTRIYGCIQTDASINQGNSGGPLLDSSGRVVGVNTATFTRAGTGRGSGVNFALPIDVVRDVVPKLIVYGNASGKRV